MKKMLYGAVAALMALAACETIQPVEEPLERPQENVSAGRPSEAGSVSDSVLFTASLGVQSKTYLEYDSNKYKTFWSEGDVILIWDPSCFDAGSEDWKYEFCTIKSGAGTSIAKFAGTLEADSYVAIYQDVNTYQGPYNGLPLIYMPNTQYLTDVNGSYNIANGQYPMIAVSNTKELVFQNLCSILKISIKGNGEKLRSISVMSRNGEAISGYANVVGTDACDLLDFVSYNTSVKYYCSNAVMSSVPIDCYVVVPAQTYSHGLEIFIETSAGSKSISTEPLTTYRSRFYDVSIDFEPEIMPDGWYLQPMASSPMTSSNAHNYALIETSSGVYEKFMTVSNTCNYTIANWNNGVLEDYASLEYGEHAYGDYTYNFYSVVPFDQSQWYYSVADPGLYHVRLDTNIGELYLLPTKWTLHGGFNGWGNTDMSLEEYSTDFVKYAARGLVVSNPSTMFCFDYTGNWALGFNGTDVDIDTCFGDSGSKLTTGCFINLADPGVYDVELTWSLTDGGLTDCLKYNVIYVSDDI